MKFRIVYQAIVPMPQRTEVSAQAEFYAIADDVGEFAISAPKFSARLEKWNGKAWVLVDSANE